MYIIDFSLKINILLYVYRIMSSAINELLIEINNKLERPKSDNTISSYAKVYRNHIQPKFKLREMKTILKNREKVLDLLSDKGTSTKKQILSVIRVLQDHFKIQMNFDDVFEKVNEEPIKKPISPTKKIETIYKFEGTLEEIVGQIKSSYNDNSELSEIKEKVNDIESVYDKMLFKFLTNYPSLRGDYNSIKIKNYTPNDNYYLKGTVYFNNLLKVNNKIKIELGKSHRELVESWITDRKSDYLFNQNNPDSFRKYVSTKSKKYFGKTIGLTKFRHLHSSSPFTSVFQDKLQEAKQMNHSLNVKVNHYMD